PYTTLFRSNNFRHHCKCQRRFAPIYSHRVGTLHSHRRNTQLLPVGYYHLVFSVPHALVPLIWQNKRLLFALLFEASATTLLEIAADPKHLGAKIGFLSILHTWGQNLLLHPHVHCAIPSGGFSSDHTR